MAIPDHRIRYHCGQQAFNRSEDGDCQRRWQQRQNEVWPKHRNMKGGRPRRDASEAGPNGRDGQVKSMTAPVDRINATIEPGTRGRKFGISRMTTNEMIASAAVAMSSVRKCVPSTFIRARNSLGTLSTFSP